MLDRRWKCLSVALALSQTPAALRAGEDTCDPNIFMRLEFVPKVVPPGTHTRLRAVLDFNHEGTALHDVGGYQWALCLDEGLTLLGSSEEPAYASFTTDFGGFADYQAIGFVGATDPALADIEHILFDEANASFCNPSAFPGCGVFTGFVELDQADLTDSGMVDITVNSRTVFEDPDGGLWVEMVGALPDELAIIWSPDTKFNWRLCPNLPLNSRCLAGARGIFAEVAAYTYIDAASGGPAVERGIVNAFSPGGPGQSRSIRPRNGILDADIPIRVDRPAGTYRAWICGANVDGSPFKDFIITVIPASGRLLNLQPCDYSEAVATLTVTEESFWRGDCNGDGRLNIVDALCNIFCRAVPEYDCPPCADAQDVDDDGRITMGDVILLLHCLFVSQSFCAVTPCEADAIADNLPRCEFTCSP